MLINGWIFGINITRRLKMTRSFWTARAIEPWILIDCFCPLSRKLSHKCIFSKKVFSQKWKAIIIKWGKEEKIRIRAIHLTSLPACIQLIRKEEEWQKLWQRKRVCQPTESLSSCKSQNIAKRKIFRKRKKKCECWGWWVSLAGRKKYNQKGYLKKVRGNEV